MKKLFFIIVLLSIPTLIYGDRIKVTGGGGGGGGAGTASMEGTVNGIMFLKAANTGAGANLMVWDDVLKQVSIGIGTTGNLARLYIKGAGTETGFALRIADSTPTDRLVVLDNGNVGIGTTNPASKLDVVGTILQNGIGLVPYTGATANINLGGYTLSGGDLDLTGYSITANSLILDNAGQIIFDSGGANETVITHIGNGLLGIKGSGGINAILDVTELTTSDKTFIFPNASGAFIIADSVTGNVGIGTTNPVAKLEVAGNIKVQNEGKIDFWTVNGDWAMGMSTNSGITTSLVTTYADYIKYSSGNLDRGFVLGPNGGNSAMEVSGLDGRVYFRGNVGIGTTSPTQKLDIVGTMRTTDTVPLMRLNILNPSAGTIPGAVLSITKNYLIDTMYAQIIGGTEVIFTLREQGVGGTGTLYNLSVGQTATTSLLTVTSFTGGSVPPKNLLVIDINSVAGTVSSMRLEIHGHEL